MGQLDGMDGHTNGVAMLLLQTPPITIRTNGGLALPRVTWIANADLNLTDHVVIVGAEACQL
jgi:hypothetical protein